LEGALGWKSTVRSINRAVQQAKKDELKRQKYAEKTQLIAFSAQAVTDLDEHIHNITSVHHSSDQLLDWSHKREMIKASSPVLPSKYDLAVQRAALDLAEFKPNIFRIFQGGNKACFERLKKTHQLAIRAKANAVEDFNKDHKDWEDRVSSIERALQGEVPALKELLKNIKNLSDDSRVGKNIFFEISNSYIHAKPIVHSSDIVPAIGRKQLASGRLSETKMPDAQFHEIYQDYVCSVAFRVGAEVFNTVPLNTVFVTCHTDMLDASTGHIEETAILSVQFMRSTFEKLNLKNIDPSDALRNFKHSMDFKRSKGFEKITPL